MLPHLHGLRSGLFAALLLLAAGPTSPHAETAPAGTPATGPEVSESLLQGLEAASSPVERERLLLAHPDQVTPKLGEALVARGDGLRSKGEHARAFDLYSLAGGIAERTGDRVGQANALRSAGTIHYLEGRLDEALAIYQESLALAEAAGHQGTIARVANNIALVRMDQGNYTEAIESLRRSLPLAEAAGDRIAAGRMTNNIAVAHMALGDYEEAAADYERALALAEAIDDQEGVMNALGNLSIVHDLRGDYSRALGWTRRALDMAEAGGRRGAMARMLTNAGSIYRDQGDLDQALQYYRRALALAEEVKDKELTAVTLNNVALVHEARREYPQALQHHERSLALKEELNDRMGIAGSLENIGLIHDLQGDPAGAMEYYERSLAISEALGTRPRIARTLLKMAAVHLERGEPQRALENADRATALARQNGEQERLWEARTSCGQALLALDRPQAARQAFEEAIAIIEALRGQVAGDEHGVARYFEDRLAPYHALVSLSLEAGDVAGALQMAERAKSRVLVETLRHGRSDPRQVMSAAERGREKALVERLSTLNSRMERQAADDAEASRALTEALTRARLELEAFRTELYAAHDELRVVRGEIAPWQPGDVFAILPTPDSALLEYVVTDEKTWVFVIRGPGSGGPAVFPIVQSRLELASRVDRFRTSLARRDLAFRDNAMALYALLVGPARQALEGVTKLLVVPDGPLWDLPFQALQPAADRYLLETYALAYAPSLSALREFSRSGRPRSEGPTLLAFGNPIDPGTAAASTRSAPAGAAPEPLPEAAKEVRALSRLYGRARSRVYVGPEAREDRFKKEAASWRVLHLATHGTLSDASPMYSSLALRPSGDGAAPEDGRLEAWEVMGLRLEADLVVLSACETARGRTGAGEGMIGLTWAFLVAGAPATVVSQWAVESASTTALMLELHRGLRSGLTTAEALRRASLKLLRDPKQRHPFYWAGFILVGSGF